MIHLLARGVDHRDGLRPERLIGVHRRAIEHMDANRARRTPGPVDYHLMYVGACEERGSFINCLITPSPDTSGPKARPSSDTQVRNGDTKTVLHMAAKNPWIPPIQIMALAVLKII